jgi:hypothetical protein
MMQYAVTTCLLAAVGAQGDHRDSNGTGGGNFNATTTWAGGVVPLQASDDWTVKSGDTVTIPNNYTWIRNVHNSNEGALVIQPLGLLSQGRVYSLVAGWSIQCSGTATVTRMSQGTAATGTLTLNGGVFHISDDNAMNSSVTSVLNAGRLKFSNQMGPTTLSGGVLDKKFGGLAFGGTFTWESGTLANARPGSLTERIELNKLKGDCILDLNDQTSNGVAAVSINMGNWALNPLAQAGTIQFDVYSNTVNNCDAITNLASSSVLSNGVTVAIGSGKGLPGIWSDYTGKVYQVLQVNGSYAKLNPSVPDALWTWLGDGKTYPVQFDNHIFSDGGVTVQNIGIPEPVAALVLLTLGALLRRGMK